MNIIIEHKGRASMPNWRRIHGVSDVRPVGVSFEGGGGLSETFSWAQQRPSARPIIIMRL